MRGVCACGLLLGCWLLISGAAEAQPFRWLAFGDSITYGHPVFDEQNLGGYPGRLEDLLGCTQSTCEVVNRGEGGEKTAQGVTRIDLVLAADGPFDVMTLMEGTNDVFRSISNATIQFNLEIIAAKAEAQGTETVHASVIWFRPDGKWGTTKDDEVQDVRNRMAAVAASEARSFVDIWSVLCPPGRDVHGHTQSGCFSRHYFQPTEDSKDPVGHPVASGFAMMANEFFRVLTAVPPPTAPAPISPKNETSPRDVTLLWSREAPGGASWYEIELYGPTGLILSRWLKAAAVCSDTECSFTDPPPLTDGGHTWRVRGRSPAGFGPWSASAPFTVTSDLIFQDGFESGSTAGWSLEDL